MLATTAREMRTRRRLGRPRPGSISSEHVGSGRKGPLQHFISSARSMRRIGADRAAPSGAGPGATRSHAECPGGWRSPPILHKWREKRRDRARRRGRLCFTITVDGGDRPRSAGVFSRCRVAESGPWPPTSAAIDRGSRRRGAGALRNEKGLGFESRQRVRGVKGPPKQPRARCAAVEHERTEQPWGVSGEDAQLPGWAI